MVPTENLMCILIPRGRFSWSATAVVSAVSGVWILCIMNLSRNEFSVCKGVIHLQGRLHVVINMLEMSSYELISSHEQHRSYKCVANSNQVKLYVRPLPNWANH